MKDLKLLQVIMGDITVNENYGLVMKKWRDLFNITQSKIAKKLDIKQSVISDYENNRRKSPGIEFIRKYTIALLNIARQESRKEYDNVKKELIGNINEDSLFRGEFSKGLKNKDVLKLLNATQIIAPEEQSVFGNYLFFSDNISGLITKKPTYELLKELKNKENTVFIFSNVKTGKLPLITLKILSKLNKWKFSSLNIREYKYSIFLIL
jgi:putative transcriptional regulator